MSTKKKASSCTKDDIAPAAERTVEVHFIFALREVNARLMLASAEKACAPEKEKLLSSDCQRIRERQWTPDFKWSKT